SRNRRANPAGTATVVGRSSAPFADEALQLAYRAGVSVLDSPLYPGQRQAASARDGRRGSGTLPQRPGAQGAGGAQYPEPGAVGAAVPVSRGAGAGTAVDGERGTGQARAALAGGAVARGNDGFAAPSVQTRGVDGGAAVRQRPAIDGVPAPAGQGRGPGAVSLPGRRTADKWNFLVPCPSQAVGCPVSLYDAMPRGAGQLSPASTSPPPRRRTAAPYRSASG